MRYIAHRNNVAAGNGCELRVDGHDPVETGELHRLRPTPLILQDDGVVGAVDDLPVESQLDEFTHRLVGP